jgi:hypothetical protein
MLLIIFGAGASYDSVQHLPPPKPKGAVVNNWSSEVIPKVDPRENFRPPLACQLFDTRDLFANLIEEFGDIRPLVPRLRSCASIEQQLASFEEEAKDYPDGLQQLVAVRYYLHSALWQCQKEWRHHHRGTNNYVTFLDVIKRWQHRVKEPICLVTFNYDTMLEEAMTQVLGYSFHEVHRYIGYDNYKLIKLHGSISWGLELLDPVEPVSPREVIANARTLRVSDRFRMVDRRPVIFEDNRVGFPAIAIPVEKKNDFSCPPSHVEVLGNLIRSVTRIITVGWRAKEEAFVNMLKSPLTGLAGDVDLMIVSGDEKGWKETEENLNIGDPTTARKRVRMNDGFTGLINNTWHLEAFLK